MINTDNTKTSGNGSFYNLLFPVFLCMIFSSCNTSKHVKSGVPTASFTNTYWKLSEINSIPLKTPDNAREVHIKFVESGNRFQGFAGCNALGGNYILSGTDGIKITAISTKMFCDRMETENFLSDAVTKANRYRIEGEKLFLYEGKKLLISFDSVYF